MNEILSGGGQFLSTLTVEFLLEVVDHVAQPIFVKNRNFEFVLVNPALCQIVGLNRRDMLGKTDYDFFPPAEADVFRRNDEKVFQTGEVLSVEEEPITNAEGQQRIFYTTKVPLRNEAREVEYLVGIINDITQLKETQRALRLANAELEQRVDQRTEELAQAEAALLRKERLAVLGQLAGGLAHQIRNPLASITNATSLLRHSLGKTPSEEATLALRILEEEAWQANRILTDLVDYARVRPPQLQPTDIREFLERLIQTQTIPPGIQVESEIEAVPPVWADEAHLHGALRNLIQNALEAMPRGGLLRVECGLWWPHCVIRIWDTGPGLAPEVRRRLFDPLVTTKSLGLGLGLTTARTLVENQRGTLECKQTGPEGTCFEIRLLIAT